MAKTPVVIYLDTDLINQIKAALPNTRFESVEAAVADLVADAVTGDDPVWTEAISWMPKDDCEEESSPADRYAIGNIPREIASKINPIINASFQTDTLDNAAELCEALGEMVSEDDQFKRENDYRYLFGFAVSAALKYEAAYNAVRRKQL